MRHHTAMAATATTALLIVGLWVTSGLVTEHFFVSQLMSWDAAQSNCIKLYSNLSSIKDEQEMNQLVQTFGNRQTGWIGLHRKEPNSSQFFWVDGTSYTYQNWEGDNPDNYLWQENCVQVIHGKWNDLSCNHALPSFCSLKMRDMVVVQDYMTWEEALVYCRSHYKDLVSLLTEKEQTVVREMIRAGQGTYWWTGLRYLGNSWMWVNGDPMNWSLTQVPQCPTDPYHCGALRADEQFQVSRNCEEQLGFICLAE